MIKPFLEFDGKSLRNWLAKILGHFRGKDEKNRFLFTIKSYFFPMNLNSTQFQLLFEVYYIFVAKN